MTMTQWLLFFLIVQVIHFLGTWKLYVKAGRKAWEAAVPVYNAVVLMKIIKRPWWWTILLFVPIVNLIMFPVVWVETIRSYGKHTLIDTVLVIATLGFYIYYLNYIADVKYQEDRALKAKSSGGELVSSILFAVVAATIVHTYVMQPFTIPTSSLEKTLLVGDFLFVSKFHYGARTPMTTVSFPMVHDSIPFIHKKSYSKWPQLPYFRLPGFQKVKRADIVVFSWPVDTVNAFYGLDDGKYYHKPIDKKSNYVKRCVGLPGDSLRITDGIVYVNNKQLELPDRARLQYSYVGESNGGGFNAQQLYERYDITDGLGFVSGNIFQVAAMTDEGAEAFKNHPSVVRIQKLITPDSIIQPDIFPKGSHSLGNKDNMRTFYIPKKGETAAINAESIPFYKRLIEVYEGEEMEIANDITQNGTQVLLNGSPLTTYTFKQDYYWMMGDNRHNSEDSRYWGFVPRNHIVGKPVFVWLSLDKNAKGLDKIRWERMFTTVGGNGKPVSYFIYFLIAIAAYFIISKVVKAKRK